MKRQGVFLLSPGWDAGPLQGYPQVVKFASAPLHLGGERHHESYSLSPKTMNTRKNFWTVDCFATNQMRDETAKDNRQTVARSSHDLTRNNELSVSFSPNLYVYRYQMLNMVFFSISGRKSSIFLPQTNTSRLIPSVQKPDYRTDLKLVKKYGSKITNHGPLV